MQTIAATFLAFVCFCLAASERLSINDLLDLPADRDHPRKSHRPFAAGKIPITHGIMLAMMLMAARLCFSLFLPWRFTGILSIYVACTVAYSLILKRKLLIDVIMLGGLYTLRILGGLAAINTHRDAMASDVQPFPVLKLGDHQTLLGAYRQSRDWEIRRRTPRLSS